MFRRIQEAGRSKTRLVEESRATCCFFAFCFLVCSAARSQHVSGDLQFRVVDSLGQPIADVNVTATGVNVQGTRGCASDVGGNCTMLNLPLGKITVRLSHANYQWMTFQDVLIALGRTTSLGEIRLQQRVHDMPELVISGRRPVIDPTSTTYGANLRASDFENLPVERSYRSMTSLLPQANLSYFGDEVNIGGATGFENKYFMDGVEVTNPVIGTSSINLPYNLVQEVEVKAGGYEAEFRSALGGLINAVTYSGTNELHGSAFAFYSSNRFGGSRRVGLLDPPEAGFSDYDVGFGIGGPIIHDQLWFYAAYNPTFALRDVTVPSFGISADKTLIHSMAAKLTWSAAPQMRFTLTTTGDPTTRKAINRRGYVPPGALLNPDPYFEDVRGGGLNLSLNGIMTLGDNVVLDATASRIMRYLSAEPSTERGEEIFFRDLQTGVWSGGVEQRFDAFATSTTGTVKATLLAGAHTIKGGLEYKVKRFDYLEDVARISKLNDTTYFETTERYQGLVGNRMPSAFLQDTWEILRGLRVHLGIRWDGQYFVGSNNEVVQTVSVPLQPRVGFTYILNEEGTQKVFGSFGRFAQELNLLLSDHHTDQGFRRTVRYRQDPRISRVGGATTRNIQHTIRPEVEGLRGQHFDEFSLGYEQALDGTLRVSLQGVYRTLREVIDDVWLASENRYQFGNPGKGILAEWPRPRRDYSALVFTIERRAAEDFSFLASYVLSRDYGNYEGLFDALSHSIGPNQNLAFDDLNSARENATGFVPNDRTHVFKLSGFYHFSFGTTVGIFLRAQSGTPLSEYASTDDGIRFLTSRGSAGRTPAIWDLNMRVTHALLFAGFTDAKLILDVSHIASQRVGVDFVQERYGAIDANGVPSNPNPTYGQAYRYQPPMSVRVGMEVSF